jgi:hypothetical protein
VAGDLWRKCGKCTGTRELHEFELVGARDSRWILCPRHEPVCVPLCLFECIEGETDELSAAFPCFLTPFHSKEWTSDLSA